MKIIVTGSLGNISKPLTLELINKGHSVTVISSKTDRTPEIEALGAAAAIGSVEDKGFLTATFTGADAVYTMMPPGGGYFDATFDLTAYSQLVGENFKSAILASGVKHVVNLSSWGADKESGTGGIRSAHIVEEILNQLPSDISICHIRPTSFYYNLLNYIPAIKKGYNIASNYGGDDNTVLVAPSDIANAIAEELEAVPAQSRSVRYVASDEVSCNEVARILGQAVGKPDLKWVLITDQDAQQNLEAIGMPANRAADLVELQAAHHSGHISEDYYKSQPAVMGKVKLADYAKVFAAAYTQNH